MNLKDLPEHIAVAVLAYELAADAAGTVTPPAEFRLMPMGRFRSGDGSGRPLEVSAGWLLTPERAALVAAVFNTRRDARVIDYEHQTLNSEKNGQPAPAAGWMPMLEVRADGLWVVGAEWTTRAATMIGNREYRYVSPVFAYDTRTGEVLSIAHAALTNYAGLDGLTDLLAGSAAALSALFNHQEMMPMKTLLAALGLTESATEAEALAALNARTNAHQSELAALKGAAPDATKYVEVAVLTGVQAELATANQTIAELRGKEQAAEIDTVIEDAMQAGKITPATEPHARKLAAVGLEALKAFIADQPAVVKPGTQTEGKGKGGNDQQLTDADTAVMKALGLTAEQFAAGKKQEA